MADNVDLQAREREERGKNAARRLRASGMVPAVLYGDGDGQSKPLSVPSKIVDYTLHHLGDNALYDIDLGSGAATARIVDVHRDPVSGRLIHVDFAPVNMQQRIEVTVPLHVVGESPGAEEGGVLQQVAYEATLAALSRALPPSLVSFLR
jgi:large subunit ribosomal protein L25